MLYVYYPDLYQTRAHNIHIINLIITVPLTNEESDEENKNKLVLYALTMPCTIQYPQYKNLYQKVAFRYIVAGLRGRAAG